MATVDIGVNAEIDLIRLREQGSNPSAPSASHWNLFVKSNGLFIQNSAGGVIGPLVTGSFGAGTSFPVTGSVNDIFFRTDRAIMYFYNGTYWLSTQEYRETFFPSDNVNPHGVDDGTFGGWPVRHGDNGIFVLSLEATILVATTNDGSNYWEVEWHYRDQANNDSLWQQFDTSGDAPTQWYDHSVTVNALLTGSARYLNVRADKISAPGNIYVYPAIRYRLIG